MSMNFPFLSILILLPIVGALFIFLFVRGDSKTAVQNMRAMAFWTSFINFLLSVVIFCKFNIADSSFQFVEKHQWIKDFDIGYHVGIDGLSLTMILLTTILIPVCILCGKNSITHRNKEFLISFLMLESFIIGTFSSLDLVLFYIFFEVMLIPMFLIIGIWGGQNRIYAAYKFFLYTFFGSILFLLAVIAIIMQAETANILILSKVTPELFSLAEQQYLWWALFIAFAVKIPMWPFHTWLPDAHVQAPTSGSVILAAVLLKMGAYGFIRFSIPMLPDASFYYKEFIFVISVIAIIYTSIVAFHQTDIKKLVAYSSIAHMGFVTLGIFSFNMQGMVGAIFQMISHGIISGALFISIGVIYERMKTRDIKELGGIANSMPKYSILFLIFTFGSVALPATSGFVGEFLILLGAYKASPAIMVLASSGVVLGAVYMLWLVKRMIMGEVLNDRIATLQDITFRELIILAPLALMVIIFGVYPAFITDIINVTSANILDNFYSLAK